MLAKWHLLPLILFAFSCASKAPGDGYRGAVSSNTPDDVGVLIYQVYSEYADYQYLAKERYVRYQYTGKELEVLDGYSCTEIIHSREYVEDVESLRADLIEKVELVYFDEEGSSYNCGYIEDGVVFVAVLSGLDDVPFMPIVKFPLSEGQKYRQKFQHMNSFEIECETAVFSKSEIEIAEVLHDVFEVQKICIDEFGGNYILIGYYDEELSSFVHATECYNSFSMSQSFEIQLIGIGR